MVALSALQVGAGLVAAAPVALVGGVVSLLSRLQDSVGTAPPTAAMVDGEVPRANSALFRHFPALADTLAWRSLGAVSATPIHRCTLTTPSGRDVEFLVKREDLISSKYGGNKVRTLQHQLATIEARLAAGDERCANVHTIGSGGSNQVVATVVHGREQGLRAMTPLWLDSDAPDLDNTLNMLSTLSLPLDEPSGYTWGEPWPMLRRLLGAAYGDRGVVVTVGGNCPAGVLGQAGGMLELAEQVRRGELPRPDRIYLPVGSACTVSGLILGLALERHLQLGAFDSDNGNSDDRGEVAGPPLRIVAACVHPLQRGWALRSPLLRFLPFTIQHTVRAACAELKRLGGPDVLRESLRLLQSQVDIVDDADLVGSYGGHSDRSRAAAQAYDSSAVVVDGNTGDDLTLTAPLWVCGHFVAKALAPLLEDAAREEEDDDAAAAAAGRTLLLWQTKSAVQPRGELDEWQSMREMPAAVREWADRGTAESVLRPGKVDTAAAAEGARGYRHLMAAPPSSTLAGEEGAGGAVRRNPKVD